MVGGGPGRLDLDVHVGAGVLDGLERADRAAELHTGAGVLDGDIATADSCRQFYADTATAPRLQFMGHYRDAFRRTPEGWRLAHRRITLG